MGYTLLKFLQTGAQTASVITKQKRAGFKALEWFVNPEDADTLKSYILFREESK